MTQRLSVRRATLDDLDVVVELRLALLREYGDHPFYGALRDDADARARDFFGMQILAPREAIYLARRGDRAIGIMRLAETVGSPLLEPERYCYVSSVYVRPEERRRGVLHAMMAEAERWCGEHGLTEMRLHNSSTSSTAQGAWSALGFEVVEEVRRRAVAAPSSRAQSRRRSHAEAY
ncbi:MAG TPA: GNAT family N-acetyltransferase [Gemmatimonadaceae bacterium]|nr:GNAT family N-acetyltransferase [Gemmatimonadaceae bacterium]